MGLSPFSSSSFDMPIDVNPDPTKYKIKKVRSENGHLAVFINYDDCTNYEGDKVLVFKDTTIDQLRDQKAIDPHFSDNSDFKSPFARFRPTDGGWREAVDLINKY